MERIADGETLLKSSEKRSIAVKKSLLSDKPGARRRTFIVSKYPIRFCGKGRKMLQISSGKFLGNVHAGGNCWSEMSKPMTCAFGYSTAAYAPHIL